MTTIQKLEWLNKVNKNSVNVCHFTGGWEIHSYQDNTPLNNVDSPYPYLHNKSLKKLIDETYEYVKNIVESK